MNMKTFLATLFFAIMLTFVYSCTDVKTIEDCEKETDDDGKACLWCKCAAVPSMCANETVAARLPPSVFECKPLSLSLD